MSLEAWGEVDDSAFDAAIEAGWIDPADQTKALIDVMNERDRQHNEEGFDPARDDAYTKGELAAAAACYVSHIAITDGLMAQSRFSLKTILDNWRSCNAPTLWPWDAAWWKPTDRRRDLVKAAALILAEIERLDRAEAAKGGEA